MADLTERKLKIESEILALLKQRKDTKTSLEILKEEQADVLVLKDKNVKDIEKQGELLLSAKNKVSDERLKWGIERDAEKAELKDKKVEVDRILAKAVELDKQEAKIKEIFEKNADYIKEKRQVVLDIKDKEAIIDSKLGEMSFREVGLKDREQSLKDKVIAFNLRIETLLTESKIV